MALRTHLTHGSSASAPPYPYRRSLACKIFDHAPFGIRRCFIVCSLTCTAFFLQKNKKKKNLGAASPDTAHSCMHAVATVQRILPAKTDTRSTRIPRSATRLGALSGSRLPRSCLPPPIHHPFLPLPRFLVTCVNKNLSKQSSQWGRCQTWHFCQSL